MRHLGAIWIPQQIWSFRRMPVGLWTVCLHVNALAPADFDSLKRDFLRFAPRITSVGAVLEDFPPRRSNPVDHALMHAWRASLRLRQRYVAAGQ